MAPVTQVEVWTGTPSPIWGNMAASLTETSALVMYFGSPQFQLVDVSNNTPSVIGTATTASLGLNFTNIVSDSVGSDGQGNDEGLYAAIFPVTASSTATELVVITEVAGALDFVVTSTGLADWFMCRPLGDSTGVGAARFPSPYSDYYVYEYDLSGTVVWSTSYTAGPTPIYFPRSSRFVTDDAGTLDLRDDTGSVLSTLSYTPTTGSARWLAVGRDHVAYLSEDGTTSNISVRVLDTTGDVLSWVAATQTIATDWSSGMGVEESSSWGGQITASPKFISAAISIYWIDPASGLYASTVTDSDGITRGKAVGLNRTLFYDNGGTLWHLWSGVVVSARSFLRLHQSPVRTPSRVRPPQLRQRQRPEVIT